MEKVKGGNELWMEEDDHRTSPGKSLKLELGSPPVTPLGVVTDRVSGTHANPLGNRSVLLLLFRQHLFDLQRFMGPHLAKSHEIVPSFRHQCLKLTQNYRIENIFDIGTLNESFYFFSLILFLG